MKIDRNKFVTFPAGLDVISLVNIFIVITQFLVQILKFPKDPLCKDWKVKPD